MPWGDSLIITSDFGTSLLMVVITLTPRSATGEVPKWLVLKWYSTQLKRSRSGLVTSSVTVRCFNESSGDATTNAAIVRPNP